LSRDIPHTNTTHPNNTDNVEMDLLEGDLDIQLKILRCFIPVFFSDAPIKVYLPGVGSMFELNYPVERKLLFSWSIIKIKFLLL